MADDVDYQNTDDVEWTNTPDVDWEPIDMTDEVPGAEQPQYVPGLRRRRR